MNVRITYYLEGQEVSAEEIAGKTGKVKIRFDYENSTDVPFMVLSAAMLPADVFSDVEVKNGRLLDLGDQKAVIGFAFPGLMDTLKLVDYEPTEEIELPEYVEIEARAEEFALDFTASVVSTGLFEELEDKDLEDLDKLPEDMDELTDASSEIRDAAQELADGGSEFGDYLSQYFDGLSQLSQGTDSLDQGLTMLSQNISKISEGSKSLQGGLEQIDQSLAKVDLSALSSSESSEAAAAARAALESLGQNSAALKEKLGEIGTELEAVQSFAENVSTYIGQVQALQQAVEEMPEPDLAAADEENGWTESLNAEATSQAKAQAIEMIDQILDSVPEDTRDEIEAAVNMEDIEISLDETFGEIRDGIQKDAEECRNTLTEASSEIVEPEVPDLEVLSPEKTEEITKTIGEMEQSLAIIAAYAEGMSQTASSLTELSGALTQLKTGISQLSGGSAKLTEGLGLFEQALGAASEGSSQLASAMNTVTSAGGELGSAYWQLVDGMNEFADGIAEFDEEGIQSLAELAGPEYKDVIRGIRAARDAEHSYTNFSGICDGQKGSVRFIIETEEINNDK